MRIVELIVEYGRYIAAALFLALLFFFVVSAIEADEEEDLPGWTNDRSDDE